MFKKVKWPCAVPQVNKWWGTKTDLRWAGWMTVRRAKIPDVQQQLGLFDGICGFDFVLCDLPLSIWTFFSLQPHVHGWNSSLSLTRGWHKVILSLLKWYKPNTREATSSLLFLVFWNGLFIPGKDYNLLSWGVKLPALGGGWGREWLNNHFLHRCSYSLTQHLSQVQ